MKKQRAFRPTVGEEMRLEDRVVLSQASAAQVLGLWGVRHAAIPTTNAAAVKATLTQIHNALVSFSRSMVPALQAIQAQYNAGTIDQLTAQNLAGSYANTQVDRLNFLVRSATHRLPYGAGFNAYLPFAGADRFTALPSGGASLFARLTFTDVENGPIGAMESQLYGALFPGFDPDTGEELPPDFDAAIAAVSLPSIALVYAGNPAADLGSPEALGVKGVTAQYIVDGVANHDFRYKG